MLGMKRIRRWIPVCVSAYQATVVDNAKSIGCIWWHNIHHPNWVIIQCSSESSKLCVHIHNITDGIGLQLWHQLLVVIDPLNPQLCVSSEHLRAGVLNELQSFGWSGESFRPSGSLSNTKLFHTFLLRYNTRSHGHIPEVTNQSSSASQFKEGAKFLSETLEGISDVDTSTVQQKQKLWNWNSLQFYIPGSIRLNGIITDWWVSLRLALLIAGVVVWLLPDSKIPLHGISFVAHVSQQSLYLIKKSFLFLLCCFPTLPVSLIVNRWPW